MSYSQKTYVPDDIFEAWLEGNGYGDSIPYNDSVLTSSIETITSLDIYNKQITDITGVEKMINLYTLNASDNLITFVNLTNMPSLRNVYLQRNDIVTADFSGTNDLEYLYLYENLLTQLTLPDSSYVNNYWCQNYGECGLYMSIGDNQLSTINFPSSLRAWRLYASNNPFDSIDVSSLSDLQELSLSYTNLVSLDLSSNNNLEYISIFHNDSLLSLDVKNKIDLKSIHSVDNDELTNLDLRNINLVNINNHDFRNNPQLNCISVDNLTVANTLLYNIDPNCVYSLNCTGLGCTDPAALNYDPSYN